MKTSSKIVACALLCSLIGVPAQAGVVAAEQDAFKNSTVIDFDELSDNTSLNTQYAAQGVADFNAQVLNQHGFARTSSSLVPAFSGSQLVYFGGSIQLGQAVDRVGAWIFKTNGMQYLSALDAAQNVLMSVAVDANSADSMLYDFVGIKSDAADIAYVVLTNSDLSQDPNWDIAGPTTFFDDFTFGGTDETVAVPEPASMSLLGMGLLALAGLRSRKRG